MLHQIIFNGNRIIEEIFKNMGFQSGEKPSSIEDCGLVRDIRNRIDELGLIEKKAHVEREALTHLCDYIIAAFKGEAKSPFVAPKAPEEAKPPVETETPKAAEGTSSPIEMEAPSQPKATEGTSSPDDLDMVIPRLKILEDGAEAFENLLKDAPMIKRFKQVGDMYQEVVNARKINPEHNRVQRTARLEMAMGNAITFLQTSKLAARFALLREARKIAEETMERKSQV